MFGKLVVSFIILANSLFAMAVLYIFRKTGSEPTVLIGAWFAFTGGELWTLATIKKNKEGKKNEV